MKISNLSNLTFAPLAGRTNFPGHSMTLIAKATYSLKPGCPPVAIPKQPFPTGDEFYPDDEEKNGPPRYESDFAYFKPKADLLLVGTCHPPGGKPIPVCQAVFQVGTTTGKLTVAGDRRWEKKLLSRSATAPQPFRTMALRYENSYGGPAFVANPIGKGHGPLRGAQGQEIWQLPNIENPAQLIQSPKDRPFPAGFAPLSPKWDTRKSKLGTYTGSYRKTRWPWFPADFDYAYFNAAVPSMQVDGFLRGDEKMLFENLHPEHAKYESRLPGVRVRCFINRAGATEKQAGNFEEVPMNLDTLWVDMETEKMVLLWRGVAAVKSEEFEDVADVFIMDENLAETPASLEACRQKFLQSLKEPEESAEEPQPPEATPPQPTAEELAAKEKQKLEMRKQMEAQIAATYKNLGMDPAKVPPEIQAKQAAMLDKMLEDDPAKASAMHEADLQNQLKIAMSKLGLDPDNLPAMSAKAHAEQIRFWESQGLSPKEMAGNPNLAKMASLMGALLPKMGHNPEDLSPLIAQMKQARAKAGIPEPESEKPPEAPLVWTRQMVEQKVALGESLAKENLSQLDLSRLNLTAADFSGANLSNCSFNASTLTRCNFTGANLASTNMSEVQGPEANFSQAALAGATLENANLKQADFTQANLAGANLTGAMLDEALFEKATLADAVLIGVSAKETLFVEADLSRAKFQQSKCPQADFTAATVNQTDFSHAALPEATVEKATGKQVNFARADVTKLRADKADFPEANLYEAGGTESIWAGANLAGANMRYAQLSGATFTAAGLQGANGSAANLKTARLNKANLTGAKMQQANLFKASFEKANLTMANLSGANAYGAEFLNAVLQGLITDGATNVKMTKLSASEA
ncbi:MAG: DUF2169 domain-containing protein [Phycisphaerae bacterium]